MRFRILILIVALCSAVTAAVLAGNVDSREEAAAPPAPEVTVAEVLIRQVHDWTEFTGRLESVERVEVRPRVNGFVESAHVNEGAQIRKGELLFQIDPRPFRAEVDRLKAEQARARAQLELARSNHQRAERLFEQNATSEEQLDGVATAVATAAANLGAVDAALDAARLELEFTRVVSPIDGRVSRILITPGNLVDGSSLLTTVVSDNPIYAYFDADEQTYLEYAGIARGNASDGPATKAYIGLINEEGHPHEGRLDFVDNQVDPASGTIRGRAVLDNSDGMFTPGLFARIKLVSVDSEEVGLIDDRAIGTALDRKYVLVVDDSNIVQYRAISVGRFVDGLRVVTDGLSEGDIVIVNGLQRARPGMPVSATRIAMADLARQPLKQVIAEPAVVVAGGKNPQPIAARQ
jgi:multidrug efflux system membrane fusion protein